QSSSFPYTTRFRSEDMEREDRYFITDTAAGLFDGANTEENPEVRISVQRKLNLVRASLHLYGIVTFKQLIHLFKKYYDMDITAREITDFLAESPYDITINGENGEIVIDDMNDEQYQM